MNKDKIVHGLSDALGFAKGINSGARVTFYRNSDFIFEGIRFDPGTYEIRKIADGNEIKGDPEF